jgi:hypothetical protein
MKKKESETIFPLPGFPSVSKQFTANGFVEVGSETAQETEPTGALRAPLGQAKTKRSPKKGKC